MPVFDDVPYGWQIVPENSYYADIETFEAGLKCIYPTGDAERDDEVIIWRPDEQPADGAPVFDGFDDDAVPDDTCYLVEVYAGHAAEEAHFCQTLDDAVTVALTEARQLAGDEER